MEELNQVPEEVRKSLMVIVDEITKFSPLTQNHMIKELFLMIREQRACKAQELSDEMTRINHELQDMHHIMAEIVGAPSNKEQARELGDRITRSRDRE